MLNLKWQKRIEYGATQLIKRKRVYICDHCGAVDLEQKYIFMDGHNLAKPI